MGPQKSKGSRSSGSIAPDVVHRDQPTRSTHEALESTVLVRDRIVLGLRPWLGTELCLLREDNLINVSIQKEARSAKEDLSMRITVLHITN